MSVNSSIQDAGMDLVPAQPLSPEAAREAMDTYQAISQALINPAEDIQVIKTKAGPRSFPKRSALQKLANAYRVSTQILSRELVHDQDGRLVRCDALVRATHPDGRYSDGDGACAITEDRFQRGADKIDHDLPATAVTRATNRAISNLIAFGAVSAEEADTGTTEPVQVSSQPAWANPIPGNAVGTLAALYVDILLAAGHPNPATVTAQLGAHIREACDGDVPICVADAIADLHKVITDAVSVAETPANGTEGVTP